MLNQPARLSSSNKATEGGGSVVKDSGVLAVTEVDCGEGRGGDTAAVRVVVPVPVALELCPTLSGDTTSELEVVAGVGLLSSSAGPALTVSAMFLVVGIVGAVAEALSTAIKRRPSFT